jgi:hypothetical protein
MQLDLDLFQGRPFPVNLTPDCSTSEWPVTREESQATLWRSVNAGRLGRSYLQNLTQIPLYQRIVCSRRELSEHVTSALQKRPEK